MFKMYGFLVVILVLRLGNCLELKNGAYEDLIITIAEDVPSSDCQMILQNLKSTLTNSSQYLYSALDSRAFIKSVVVNLPSTWPDSCAHGPINPGAGERSDLTITLQTGTNGNQIWTQQTAGCGKPGEQMYLSYKSLAESDPTVLGRTMIKEFAKYRYGVFDETGYQQDLVYPICYRTSESSPLKVTGCSDLPIYDNGICTNPEMPLNVSDLVDGNARSSIMFAPEAPSVSMFCDEGTHDRTAPNKQNFLCDRRSALDVILQHQDFFGIQPPQQSSNHITDTTPTFVFKKQTLTRYVMVVEDSSDMALRESWGYLRTAIRKWAVNDLPANTEAGLIMANESTSTRILNISSFIQPRIRNVFASNFPYSPGESRAAACLQCAIKDAIEMLREHSKIHGAANSVIVVISPGMEYSQQMPELAKEAKNSKIRIATINYPGIFRQQMLDSIAMETDGIAYTVLERKQNAAETLLTTYFQLTNVLYDIVQRFYQGNPLSLPMEIHRRELSDDGRNSVTGSFILDEEMGEPAQFALFTYNIGAPLINSLTLWSPSQKQYQARSDDLGLVKIITVIATINETGTWTYKAERYPGNPQPHFIQVTATPRSPSASVVRTKFWTGRNQPGGPLILYVSVMKRERPVMGAKVEVTVTRPEFNGTGAHREKFELLDTGSGDPDITKGDGVYTRYFSAIGGPGVYTFEVIVTDNGNTAYSGQERSKTHEGLNRPCCGSFVPTSRVQPLSPFQRVPAPITIFVSPDDVLSARQLVVGRVGDLRGLVIGNEKVKLIWNAPDMGGYNVDNYEVKYSTNLQDITDKFETNALRWPHGEPFAQSSGSETTFTMDLSKEPSLLDRPVYVAIKSNSKELKGGTISNWIRVYVSSPPPPSTSTVTYPTLGVTSWPFNNQKSVNVENIGPRIASRLDLGLQLILPIVFGIILLALLTSVYCYCCVVKRKRNLHSKSDKKLNGVSVVASVPNSVLPSVNNTPLHNNAYTCDMNDQTIGVPLYQEQYIEEPLKKRLSIVHQQEQQLIEELKQQQYQQQQHDNLSMISSGTMQRNGRTLSPYESWTASQLLHEHERRHSPSMLDEMSVQQPQPDHISITGQSLDHMSVNGRVPEHYGVTLPPPVPPLPAYNGYQINYPLYGVHQAPVPNGAPNPAIYHRNETLMPFNASLQGSMSSVNSGEKKRRNVTMV